MQSEECMMVVLSEENTLCMARCIFDVNRIATS